MKKGNINPEYITQVRQIIGSWVKQFREDKKLTLKDVAAMLEITEGTVSKIENGKWLSLEMLIKLSVKLEFFIFLVEKDSRDDLATAMRNRWSRAHDQN
ncbi:MAG: helix-turn-helix transcriptional regulator [Paludibacter sp.]|jgi:transcriptional regulator with XRE-family HTH domain|nr:helix-turn-helix transcriptional regulator [Paludibacter sp.]